MLAPKHTKLKPITRSRCPSGDVEIEESLLTRTLQKSKVTSSTEHAREKKQHHRYTCALEHFKEYWHAFCMTRLHRSAYHLNKSFVLLLCLIMKGTAQFPSKRLSDNTSDASPSKKHAKAKISPTVRLNSDISKRTSMFFVRLHCKHLPIS